MPLAFLCQDEVLPFALLLQVLGVVFILYLLRAPAAGIWLHFLRPRSSMKPYGPGRGSWALVTGASDGIGKGFVRVLAQRGFNVVLVSRTRSKLDAIAAEVHEKYNVRTAVVACDASATGADERHMFDEIMTAVEQREVSILVNNVGMNSELPSALQEMELSDIDNITGVNCRFTTKLTALMIPLLLRCKKSAIVNLSSIGGMLPTPMMSVYSGSKSYNDMFSRALNGELHSKGCTVMSVTPGYVVSNMSGFRKASLMVCTAERMAKDSLDKLGAATSVAAYWPHALMYFGMQCMPERFLLNATLKELKNVRARLIRRKEKEKRKGSELTQPLTAE